MVSILFLFGNGYLRSIFAQDGQDMSKIDLMNEKFWRDSSTPSYAMLIFKSDDNFVMVMSSKWSAYISTVCLVLTIHAVKFIGIYHNLFLNHLKKN